MKRSHTNENSFDKTFTIFLKEFEKIHPDINIEEHEEIAVINCNEANTFIISFTIDTIIKDKRNDKYFYFVKDKCIGGILGSDLDDNVTCVNVGGQAKMRLSKLSKNMWDETLYNRLNKVKVQKTREPRSQGLYKQVERQGEEIREALTNAVFKRFEIIKNINGIKEAKGRITPERVLEEKSKLMCLYPLNEREDNLSFFFIYQFVAPFIKGDGLKYYLEAERNIMSHRLKLAIESEKDLLCILQKNKVTNVLKLNRFLAESGLIDKISERNVIIDGVNEFYTYKGLISSEERIFCIPFEHTLEYVRKMQTFMYKGYCFFDCALDKLFFIETIFDGLKKKIHSPEIKQAALQGIDYLGEDSTEFQFIHFMRHYFDGINISDKIYPEHKTFLNKAGIPIEDMKVHHHPPCMTRYLLKLKNIGHLHYHQALEWTSYLLNLGCRPEEIKKFLESTVDGNRIKEYKDIFVRAGRKDKRPDWGVSCNFEIEVPRGDGEYYFGCPLTKSFREKNKKEFNEILSIYNLSGDKRKEINTILQKNTTETCKEACGKICMGASKIQSPVIVHRPPHFYFEIQRLLKEEQEEIASITAMIICEEEPFVLKTLQKVLPRVISKTHGATFFKDNNNSLI